MIPRLPQGVADLARKLATGIAPDTASRYAMANTAMIAMLLGAVAQESERAVAVRMTDVDEMRALFRGAREAADAANAAGRRLFCERAPASLRLSDVDALHAEGLRLVIDLHTWAEDHDAALDHAIWDFLAAHTERHRIDDAG